MGSACIKVACPNSTASATVTEFSIQDFERNTKECFLTLMNDGPNAFVVSESVKEIVGIQLSQGVVEWGRHWRCQEIV